MAINIDPRTLVPGFYADLTPDYAGSFIRGQEQANVLKAQKQQLQETERTEQARKLTGEILGGQLPEGMTQQQALGELFKQSPDMAVKVQKQLGVNNQTEAEEFSKFSFTLQNTPVESRDQLIAQKIQENQSLGKNTASYEQLLGLDATSQDRIAQTAQLATLSTKERLEVMTPSKDDRPASEKEFETYQSLLKTDPEAAEIYGRKAGFVKDTPQVTVPPQLLDGLSDELASKASAAYTAAGGGKDGMVAFQKTVDSGTEQERRIASPKIITESFPKASEAELVQLQAAMDSAKTTEAGLKAAGKVREEQRRAKKAKSFQSRAIELMTGILQNDELDDVLGSVEGAIDFRLQDSEAELIADIEEAANILTSDNLDLMSGVLSETDIKILQNLAGGGLSRKRSPERFKKDVEKILEKLSSNIVATPDDIAESRAPSSQVQQVGRFTVRVK